MMLLTSVEVPRPRRGKPEACGLERRNDDPPEERGGPEAMAGRAQSLEARAPERRALRANQQVHPTDRAARARGRSAMRRGGAGRRPRAPDLAVPRLDVSPWSSGRWHERLAAAGFRAVEQRPDGWSPWGRGASLRIRLPETSRLMGPPSSAKLCRRSRSIFSCHCRAGAHAVRQRRGIAPAMTDRACGCREGASRDGSCINLC
jgi:hypothetical protein